MIKTNVKDIAVIIDPLSLISGIEIVSGNVAQTFNQDTGEYESDRRVIPCVLMPVVSASDVDGSVLGRQVITGCEWYDGVPLKDASNRIVNGPDYEISAEGKPEWSLSVKKNIEPNTPIEIHALFTIEDTRRNTVIKFESSVSLYTTLYDNKVYSLRLQDQPAGWVIDPLRVTPDEGGHWYHTITAQLYSGKQAVDEANAVYWWQILDKGTWRDFTADEKAIFISDNTKALRFDARFIRRETFRCRAAYFTGDQRPTVPKDDTLVVTSTVKVEFPKTLRANIRQLAGAKVDASLNTPVKFECVISDNVNVVPAEKYNLFDITWMAVSGKPGVPAKVVGKGQIITFKPSTLEFDKKYSIAVYADVKIYAVHALVVKDNKMVTTGGKAITAIKYE